MESWILDVSRYFFTAVISSGVTWFFTRHIKRSDAINKLQDTIDKLASEYSKSMSEVLNLRKQNTEILHELEIIKIDNQRLKNERAKDRILIEGLKNEITKLTSSIKQNGK